LKDMGEYRQAIEVLRLGVEQNDEREDLHNLLGFCHYKLDDYESAITHFRRSIEVDPSKAIDYANLGVNLRKLNRIDEAVHYFQIALTMEPYLEMARNHLDELYTLYGQKCDTKSGDSASC